MVDYRGTGRPLNRSKRSGLMSPRPGRLRRVLALVLVSLPAASVNSMGSFATPDPAPLPLAQASPGKPIDVTHRRPEQELMRVLDAMQRGQFGTAQSTLDQLLRDYPNYRLAHLIQGDLLKARGRPLKTMGDVSEVSPEVLNDLRLEAQVRLKRYTEDAPVDKVPGNILQLSSAQRYLLAVDVSRSRLYVYQNDNGTPRRVDDFYITIGKNGYDKRIEGDQRTPLGVYFVLSQLPKASLPDLYGAAAFPLSYPNEWDRLQKRTGHGIWLHGSPSDTYSRPPLSSNGCVALTNQDLMALSKYLQIGVTPVIISRDFDWVNAEQTQQDRDSLLQSLEHWRQDWESRDTRRYLEHYSANFRSGSQDLTAWSAQKTAVNASKKWIKVGLSNVSLFRYPDNPDMVVATFEQDYRSDNLSSKGGKRQYWQREGSGWKIIYEDVS